MPLSSSSSMISFAFASGSPLSGAIELGTLGIGTIAAVFLYGTVIESVDVSHRKRLHRLIGVAFVALGYILFAHGLNEKQREFPAPPWVGVKRVCSVASLFLSIGTPYYGLEPTLSASQNPRTHFGIRRGAPGLCRAHVKGWTPTDTPATTATDDLCCGGSSGVFGCFWFHASLARDERGRN